MFAVKSAPLSAAPVNALNGKPLPQDFRKKFAAADTETLQNYLNGADLTLNSASLKALYQGVASGTFSVKPEQFFRLIPQNSDTKGIDVTEFSALNSDVQQWAINNPQPFFTGLLAHRNPANNDLASIGAEGGISALNEIQVRNGQLDYSGTHYLEVHDSNLLGDVLKTAAIAAAVYFGGSAILSSFGSTAAGAAGAADAAAVAGAGEVASAASAASLGTAGDALGFFTAGTNAAIGTNVADYIAAASAGLETGAATAFTGALPLASLGASSSGFLSTAWQAAKTAQSVASTANTVSKLVSGPPKLSPAVVPRLASPAGQSVAPFSFLPDTTLNTAGADNVMNTGTINRASSAIQNPVIMPSESSSLPVPLMLAAGFVAFLFMVKK